jgi:lipoprotein-anchoring transpeptidase ErfK/SrfK
MGARRAAAAVLAVIVLAGAVALALTRGGGPSDSTPTPARAPAPRAPNTAPVSPAQAARAERLRRGPVRARLLRRVQLRARPGGRVVRTLGRRTGYGSPRVLAVVARRPGWLGVLSPDMPNSRAGWIPAAGAVLLFEPYALEVDLSTRRIVVRREGRAVRRVKVAIGRAGTTTPTGRFAITDALHMGSGGAGPYGCCALALTGRQPHIPQDWGGGDRLAIHGTTDETVLGTPVSLGCLRAGNRDMRWLMKRVRPGTIVRIRA